MSPTASKSEETAGVEEVNVLPVGHPKAGYVSADLSYHTPYAAIPEEEAEWHRARNEAREEEAKKVKENEEKVYKEEAEEREKRNKEAQEKLENQEKLQQALVGALGGVASSRSTASESKPGNK